MTRSRSSARAAGSHTEREPVTFIVPGKPAPQGSKRHLGNGRMVESCKEVGAWRERVAIAAHNAMTASRQPIITEAVTVVINFVLPRPKSTPKHTSHAIKRPDLDKLTRAIFDAITGVIICDDSQVVNLIASKQLAQIDEGPCAMIAVEVNRPTDDLLALMTGQRHGHRNVEGEQ